MRASVLLVVSSLSLLSTVAALEVGAGELAEIDTRGDADGVVAVSTRGHASGGVVAVAPNGDATTGNNGVAVSGTGTARSAMAGPAVSIWGDAHGAFAVGGNGANGGLWGLGIHENGYSSYYSESWYGDARGGNLAVSVMGNADASDRPNLGVAIAPFGTATGGAATGAHVGANGIGARHQGTSAEVPIGACVTLGQCGEPHVHEDPNGHHTFGFVGFSHMEDASGQYAAISLYGDATSGGTGVAIASDGDAQGGVAAAVTGASRGTFASVALLGSTGAVMENHGATASVLGDASGHHVAVSLLGDCEVAEGASGFVCVAPIGHARGGVVSVGGCDLALALC